VPSVVNGLANGQVLTANGWAYGFRPPHIENIAQLLQVIFSLRFARGRTLRATLQLRSKGWEINVYIVTRETRDRNVPQPSDC
jgi:hypothetical protein